MDLSKAFDTIDHNILLNKLYYYWFRGISYDWFASYLSIRKQYISYQNTKSSYEYFICGAVNSMLMETTYKIRNIKNVKAASLDGCKLMHVSSAKFLGITI